MIIYRKRDNLYHNADVKITFFPGDNIILPGKVKAYKENKELKELEEAGVHEVVVNVPYDKSKSNQGPKELDVLSVIKGMPIEKIISVVKNTYNRKDLKMIGDSDMRTGVQKAVTEQMQKISPDLTGKKDKK